MCILLFLAAISLALGGLEIGTWPRIVAGITAFLVPGIYGALRCSGTAIPTEAETLEQLRNLLEE